MKRKSVKLWVTFLAIPIPLLILNTLLQFAIRFAVGDTNDSITLFINLFSLLVGVVAILLLLCFPIWIIMLVKTSNYNAKLQASQNPQNQQQPVEPQQPIAPMQTAQPPVTTDEQQPPTWPPTQV